jgi:hypothetical protein
VATEFAEEHRGGDFSPIEPTARGGPDYGRFVEAVRTLQDHARAADAPNAVITEAADLLEAASKLLAPYDAARKIVPIEAKLPVDAGVDHVDGRKMFITGRLLEGEAVLAEANALFVKLNPGQP